MPYSPTYIISQLARGKPYPKGSPNKDLLEAVSRLSPMDISQALSRGATAETRDHNGVSVLNLLLTHPRIFQVSPEIIMGCARELLRAGAQPSTINPLTRQTALAAASILASSPIASSWYDLWRTRGDWLSRRDGKSALETWRNKASKDLLERMPKGQRGKPTF